MLSFIRCPMLGGEVTILRYPVFGVMWFLERVTSTSMTRGIHPIPLCFHTWRIKLKFHQLIHIFEHQHVAVQLHNAIIFSQAEWCELAPTIIEARVVGIFFGYRRQ